MDGDSRSQLNNSQPLVQKHTQIGWYFMRAVVYGLFIAMD